MKGIRTLLLIWIITIYSFQSLAQTNLIDTSLKKLSICVHLNYSLDGSYILADTNDKIIAADVFSTEQFKIETLSLNKYRLQIMSLNYAPVDTIIKLEHLNKPLEFSLTPNGHNLNEVTVTTKLPVFEKTSEGTKVNVANSLLSKSANAGELLTRVPGVSVSSNKPKVLGRGDAMIILEGKEITYESYKSLPPSDIKSIEVITNPDSRYDSKANAVISITMKKHYSQGIAATIVEAFTVGIRKRYPINTYILNAPNMNIQFRKNKFDLNAYYANEYGKNWSENNFTTTVKANEGIYTKNGNYLEDNKNKQVHYYRMGFGYNINTRSSLSAQYDGLSHQFGLDVVQKGNYYTPLGYLTKINMFNNGSTKLLNHSFNLNYKTETDSAGSYWFCGAQYNQFRNRLLDHITESISDSTVMHTANRINDGNNVIELYTTQSDYVKKFEKGQLQAGFKYSYSINQGKIDFYSKAQSDEKYTLNTLYSNSNVYMEHIPALYITGNRKLNKWNLFAGLRWEHTTAFGKSRKTNLTLIDASYSSLFPSAKAHYIINDKCNLNLSYSRKVNRPLYQDLDPFLWYLDSLTSIQGNVKLQPEFHNQTEFRFSYKQMTVKYSFTYAQNSMAQVMKPGNAGVNSIIFTKDNIQQRFINTAGLEIPVEKNNYSSFNTIAVNLYQYVDSRKEYSALKSEPQFYFYTYQSLKVGKLFTAEFTGEYYSASFDGFTKRKPYYYFTMGISRNFFKAENLSVSLLWNDMARTAQWAGKFSVNTYSNEYDQRFTTHYVRLNITYTLPSLTKFNYTNKSINDVEYNRIKK